MARFVDGGPIATFARLNPHAMVSSNFDFFQARIAQAYDLNTDLGRSLAQAAGTATEALNGFAAIASAKAAAAQVGATLGANYIYPLQTLQEFQCAPLNMVNWIMTDPTLRGLYHSGKIEGWADIYEDLYPHETGEASTAYMLLNNGLFMDDAQNGWKYYNYGNVHSGFEPLTIQEVDAIKSAQARLAEMIALGGEDPTSQYGRMLD